MLSNFDYCPACRLDNRAHSFEFFCNTGRKFVQVLENEIEPEDINHQMNPEAVFYTKVADAKLYYDTDGIISHYENLLNKVNPIKWVWIFDCDGFGLKHSLELKTAIGIAKLISRFGRVSRILVINSNYFINFVLRSVKMFLDKEISDNTILIKSDEKIKYLHELILLKLNPLDLNKLSGFMKLN